MVPTRRTLLRAVGAAPLFALPGCLGALRSGHVDVRIENRDDRQHAVTVTMRAGGDVVFEERFAVPAGSEVDSDAVATAGEYAVTVALDGDRRTTVPFTMQGCTDNTLYVAVDDAATLEAGPLDEC